MTDKMKKEPVYFAAAGVCALFAWGFIADGSCVSKQIVIAVKRCLNIIIPSLFAFMAVSDFLIRTGLYTFFVKPFKLISRFILKMPDELFFVFLFGNLAGYPVGIKLLGSMAQTGKISKKTAEICACFCCCGGPTFYTGTIGLALFGSVKIGLGIFFSIVFSNFIIAFFICRIFKPKSEIFTPEIKINSAVLTDSVLDAGKGLFTICTMIVFFSAVMAVMDYFGLFSALYRIFNTNKDVIAVIKSFFEITAITSIKNCSYKMLPLITALCTFGGLCVILQISAINKGKINLKYFYLTRPVNCMLSALIFFVISKYVIPHDVQTISVSDNFLLNINNFSASICLILMILLLKYKKRVVFSK